MGVYTLVMFVAGVVHDSDPLMDQGSPTVPQEQDPATAWQTGAQICGCCGKLMFFVKLLGMKW